MASVIPIRYGHFYFRADYYIFFIFIFILFSCGGYAFIGSSARTLRRRRTVDRGLKYEDGDGDDGFAGALVHFGDGASPLSRRPRPISRFSFFARNVVLSPAPTRGTHRATAPRPMRCLRTAAATSERR